MEVLLFPSLSVYECCFSRPRTTTRVPLVSDSATFSAASRQMEQRMNRVSPSTHSFVCLLNERGVEATVKLATAAPLGVNRNSGSPVTLPTTVSSGSLLILFLLLGGHPDLGCPRGQIVVQGAD